MDLLFATDTPSKFAGPLSSPHAIIHTGFTGTSIYIDPDRCPDSKSRRL